MRLSKYVWVLGVVLFVVLILQLDIPALLQILRSIRLEFAILALVPVVLGDVLRGYRWCLLIRGLDKGFSLWQSVKGYLMGVAAGALTPGRVGIFVRVPLLAKEAPMKTEAALATVLVDTVLDALAVLLLGGVGIVILVVGWKADLRVAFWLFALIVAGIVAVLLFRHQLVRLVSFLSRKLLPLHFRERAEETFKEMALLVKKENHGKLLIASLLSILSWSLLGLAGYLLALAFGLPVPVLFVIAVVAVSTFVALLPISIFGLGTREATVIFLFSLAALSKESAIAFSVILAIVIAWLPALVGAAFYLSGAYRPGSRKERSARR
ncbi:MAG: lysylphosphatidylglycerol synthase transmembrane domain-containing protein [Nanoarchaeota archaeon]